MLTLRRYREMQTLDSSRCISTITSQDNVPRSLPSKSECVDAELIMDASIDESNQRVRTIRARFLVEYDKKKAMNFLTKLDRNRFMSLLDELANGKNNCPNSAVDAMHLAETYRLDGRIIDDMVSSPSPDESAYGYKVLYSLFVTKFRIA